MKTIGISFLVVLAALTMALKGDVTLEERNLLEDRVSILVPDNFAPMTEELMALKYPSEGRPSLVLTNETGGINLAFNHTASRATQNDMESYKSYLEKTFKRTYSGSDWKGSGVKEINGRKFGYLEFVSQAIDTEIYNLMFFTDLDGKLLICSFNCTKKNIKQWEPIGKEIMNSTKINEK